ncbi:MAG: glycosyltransferase [Clostridia bacterium]|nr:glycosyltransferase [Clostridia bacterium]
MIKFSIIIPVYKVEQYLDKCVQSVINQTYKNIEIILVDDGSPDDSPKMCDDYALKDERIKVVHKENGGLSDARNKGLEVATGDYVLFLDSDDYISLDATEKFLSYAENGYDILMGNAVVEGGACNLERLKTSDLLSGKEYLLKACRENKAPMAAWLNVYSKKFLDDNNLRFKKGILHEDEEFTPRCLLASKSVAYVENYFYYYLIRENSITTKKDKRKNASDFYETCLSLEKIYNNLENNQLKKLLLDSLSAKYLNVYKAGKLYQYGKEYSHKKFVFKNAKRLKTKIKSTIFVISPKLFCFLGN